MVERLLLLPHLNTPLLDHVPREVVDGDLLRQGEVQQLGAEGGHGAVVGVGEVQGVVHGDVVELHAESGCSRIFSLTTSLITLVSFTDAPLRAESGLASSSPAPNVRLPH